MIARLISLATRPANTRRVLIGAGILFLVAAAIGAPIVTLLKSESSDFQNPNAENQQVLHAIEHATGQSAYYGVAALVSSPTDVRTDPAAQAQATHVVALLSRQPGYQRALDYPATHLPELISRNGRQMLVLAAFADRERSAEAVEHVHSLPAVQPPAGSGVTVSWGGSDVVFTELNKRTSSDLRVAETFAFPILLLLSFWVFRGLVAATLPLLVGGFAIVITFLLLRLLDQFMGLSIFAVNLVTGIGLGLGIDYSLFILSRYREELARGLDSRAAIARTLQTAGRTVMFGSLTVAGALSCLLVFPLRFLYSMGIGGALVTLSAGAVSLIVLPAVLVALGPRINALAPARLQRNAAQSARPAEHGFWYRLAHGVMRRPGAVALGTAAVLIVIALPALRLALTPADAHVLPSSAQPRLLAEAITHDFAVDGSQTITMVARGGPGADHGGQAVAALARRAQVTAGAQAKLAGAPRYLGKGLWEIEMLPHGTDGSSANQQLVHRLRALASPPTLLVGGSTAWFVDQKAAIAASTPLALVILALVTGGFLFLMTGSLVLPFIALLMNLLTVAVGAGLLVLVFQDGHLLLAAGVQPDRRPGGVQPRAAVRRCVRAVHRLWRVPVRSYQGGP